MVVDLCKSQVALFFSPCDQFFKSRLLLRLVWHGSVYPDSMVRKIAAYYIGVVLYILDVVEPVIALDGPVVRVVCVFGAVLAVASGAVCRCY